MPPCAPSSRRTRRADHRGLAARSRRGPFAHVAEQFGKRATQAVHLVDQAQDHADPRIIDVQILLQVANERGAGDVAVFGGGIIPDQDSAKLKALGVRQVFTPGASTEDIVKWLRESVQPRE